jgi:GTP-binding protein EngB required for normal cell division
MTSAQDSFAADAASTPPGGGAGGGAPARPAARPPDAAGAIDDLDRLATIARQLEADDALDEARAAASRIAEQRFFLACLGQFKRGKSSLLNALVGHSVLPVGVPPVTSALTVLRHGPVARAEVRLADGGRRAIGLDDIAAFVDERDNPENAKGVVAVEVFLPVPLLETGLCLVDTPGLGSVFAGNTAVTRGFVPRLDAALVVLGSDPPITGEEADLLAQVAAEVQHVVVVLNKADRASQAELQEARLFTRKVIESWLGRPVDPLLEVSARERLEAGLPTREWVALEQALSGLARQSRSEILEVSGARAVRRLRGALLAEVGEREAALRRPVEATEARVARLREAASRTQQLLTDLGALFAATEADLARRYDDARRAFVARATPDALAELDRALADGTAGGPRRDRALEQAGVIAERRVREFLAEAEPFGEQLYAHATERFVRSANTLLAELLAQEGEPLLRIERREGFQKRRGFFYAHMTSRTHVGFWAGLGDLLGFRRTARARRHAAEYLRELLYANSMRILGDLRDRVLESRRSLEHEVTLRMTEAAAAGERAVAGARMSHASGAAAVSAELDRLGSLRRELLRLGTGAESGRA